MKEPQLTKLIVEINEAGWQVSTFSQFVDSGIWLATVRKPGNPEAMGIAQSKDPYAALKQAWTTRVERVPNQRLFRPMAKVAARERIRIKKLVDGR